MRKYKYTNTLSFWLRCNHSLNSIQTKYRTHNSKNCSFLLPLKFSFFNFVQNGLLSYLTVSRIWSFGFVRFMAFSNSFHPPPQAGDLAFCCHLEKIIQKRKTFEKYGCVIESSHPFLGKKKKLKRKKTESLK